MANTIRLRRGSGAPSAGSFAIGEPGWDSTNGRLYVKNAAGAMVDTGTPADGAVTTAKVANDAVTYAKIQNVSATDKLLGRSTAGAGDIEEITCTAAGRALLDDVDAAAQRTTLGLGTLATQSGSFSGTSSGTNTGDQTITLTGDVTGSGTGSFAATIASGAVTSAKIADGTIVDGDISASAEIAVSKLADGAARQLLQTDAAGTGVEWTSNVDVPGTLDVTGATTLDSTLSFPLGSAGSPSLYPGSDTNTGFWSPAADTIAVSTGGVERFRSSTSEVVFNEGGVDCDFRIEGDTNANLFVVDAGTDEVRVANINGGPLAGMRNTVINGSFAIAQRGTSFTSTGGANNDDTYNLDRWYVLSDGNDIVDITQTTSVVPTNGKYAIALDVETINKKFGIAQIIEADNCIGLTGQTVTLSFKAKVSATTKLDNVKAAIVAWSGTADTVTSDIISAWNVEGTNPTLIANATYENTPANLNLTTSYATYSITAAVDTASTTNILVFIWSDVTDTTLGDFLYITDVQLERGPVATPFERRPIGTEWALCQRYFCKSYNEDVNPGTVTTLGRIYFSAAAAGSGSIDIPIRFPTQMRAAPTVTAYNPSTGTSGQIVRGSSNVTASVLGVGETGCTIGGAGASTDNVQIHFTASAEL